MKIFIDDIRTADDSWHICRSVWSAVRALDMYSNEITDISLDHDISHQVLMGSVSRPYPCEETFEVVARYIALLKKITPDWSPRIVIHTSNPVGAGNMQKVLHQFPTEIKRTTRANRLEIQL